MDLTRTELLQKIVSTGLKHRYGEELFCHDRQKRPESVQ